MLESIKNLFIIGPGPSSSHTIGPYKSAKIIKSKLKNGQKVKAILYGSLALTGKGHMTDKAIKDGLSPFDCEVFFDYKTKQIHPNTIDYQIYNGNLLIKSYRVLSLGGGAIAIDGEKEAEDKLVYPFDNFETLKKYMISNNIDSLVDVVNMFEDADINEYLSNILSVMFSTIEHGIETEGYVGGELKVKKVAREMLLSAQYIDDELEKNLMIISSFAYAVSEENASNSMIVTSPTCGSAGVVPSILYFAKLYKHISQQQLIDSLKVAGMIGVIVKKNSSISGAVGGCQAEIGTASSMASAAFAYLLGLSLYQIEYAAEVSLEHFLGLTCDPVKGYVVIPCIERNGVAAIHAYTSAVYAKYVSKLRKNKVSFDVVVKTMKETGDDISNKYRETSLGGLAKNIEEEEIK